MLNRFDPIKKYDHHPLLAVTKSQTPTHAAMVASLSTVDASDEDALSMVALLSVDEVVEEGSLVSHHPCSL